MFKQPYAPCPRDLKNSIPYHSMFSIPQPRVVYIRLRYRGICHSIPLLIWNEIRRTPTTQDSLKKPGISPSPSEYLSSYTSKGHFVFYFISHLDALASRNPSEMSSSSFASLQLILLNAFLLSYISTYCAESIFARIIHAWILLSSISAFLLCYPSYYSPSTCFRGLTVGR